MWRLEHLHFHFYWFPKVTFFILFSKIHKSFRLTWMIRKEMKYFGKDGFTHEISTIVSEQFWFIVVQNESQNPFIAQDFFYYWMPKKVNFKIWLLQLFTIMLRTLSLMKCNLESYRWGIWVSFAFSSIFNLTENLTA